MGLRCLLGHDFTEPRTERDREERGEEVIISVTEVKECRRCGETRIVSENKEVTSVDQLLEESGGGAAPTGRADAVGDPSPVGDAGGAGTADANATPAPDSAPTADGDNGPVIPNAESDAPAAGETAGGFDGPAGGVNAGTGEDAEIIDGSSGSRSSAGETAAAEATDATPGADADADDPGTADADGADGERAPGEWPDSDARRGAGDAPEEGAREWPNADREPGGSRAGAADAPHTPAEGESADVEFLGGGESPDEGEAAGQARGEIDPDADDTGAVDPADGDDVEFIDGEGPGGWPEQDGEDEGYDAELDGADAGVSVDGNLSPQVDAEVADGEDVEFIEADADAADAAAGDARRNGTGPDAVDADDPSASGADRSAGGSPSRQVELTTSSDRVDTAYVCPDCGNRERVGASSMRAGDICPDCKRGYIEEREIR